MRRTTLAALTATTLLLALLPGPVGAAITETSDTLSVVKEGETPSNVELAIELAQQTPLTPSRVLIGRDDVFVDSMAAGVLQGDSPLLLVPPQGPVPDGVLAELQRMGPSRLTLLGGTGALSEQVEQELAGAGYATERRAGSSRFETAIAIAEDAAEAGGSTDTVILARAFPSNPDDPSQGFADSLAAGGMAAERSWPILLTQTEELSGPTRAWMADNGVETALIMGGTAAISQAVEDEVRNLGIATERLAGSDRFSTGIAVADKLGAGSAADVERVTLVNAQGDDAWAGGFAAAAHSAFYDAPIVLAAGEVLPPATSDWLEGGTSLAQVDGIRLTCVTPAASCEQARVELQLPPAVGVTFTPPARSTVVPGQQVRIDTGGRAAVVDGGTCLDAGGALPADGVVTLTRQPSGQTCTMVVTLELAGGVTQTETASYLFVAPSSGLALLSVAPDGTPVGGRLPEVAADGSAVVYLSSGDPIGTVNDAAWHVFLAAGATTQLVDVTPAGGASAGSPFASPAERPRISGDGRLVAFSSSDAGLDSQGRTGDTADSNLYLRDVPAGTTSLVSIDASGNPVRSPEFGAISDDGSVAVYVGEGAGPSGSISRFIFLHHRDRGEVDVVVSSTGEPYRNATVAGLDLSADGSTLAFRSASPTLVPGDTNARADVFVVTLADGSIERANVTEQGEQAEGDTATSDQRVSTSADGRFVVFASGAANLPGEGSSRADVFQRDRINDLTVLLSRADVAGTQMEDAGIADVSASGRFVAFTSTSTPAGQPAGGCGVYLTDTGEVPSRVDVGPAGQVNTNPTCAAEFATAADTGAVALSVFQPLLDGDTNTDYDVYLRLPG